MTLDDLLNQLEELRALLLTLSERLSSSGVERTVGLREALGDDCPFYVKSGQLFIKRDYKDLKRLIHLCHTSFERVENDRS